MVPSGGFGSGATERTPLAPLDGSSSSETRQKRQTFAIGESMFPSKNKTWTIQDAEETMDDVSIVINLLADLSPAGILPLAFGLGGTGYVIGTILLAIFGAAAAYMMYLIGRTVELSGQQSYDKIWEKVVGPSTSWVPIFTVVAVCFGCCLGYACFFGDLFAGAMPALGVDLATRTVCLVALSTFPLLPLCMLKDLSALAPTSFGALVAVLYTIGMMVYRSLDGSYDPDGEFGSTAEVAVPETTESHLFNMGLSSLLLVNGLAVAFLSHYNGCKYYREFIGHRPDKFGKFVGLAFGMVSCLFFLSMIFGYRTFGMYCEGTVLNNYAKNDSLANIGRIGMGLANVFSFPLMFSGLREAVLALIVWVSPSSEDTTELVVFQNSLSAVMLAIITVIAILVTDASLVVGLVGSICGAAIIYVIPCFLFVRACEQSQYSRNPTELVIVKVIGFIGVILMFAGAWATLAL